MSVSGFLYLIKHLRGVNFPPSSLYLFSDLDTYTIDLIHLHGCRLQSTPHLLKQLFVWTFHDINPISGGCHYFHGCVNWKTDCYKCPQLKNNFDNFPMRVLEAKLGNFNFNNITVIVLNEYFKKLVKERHLFENSKNEVIQNCVYTEIFKPIDTLQIQKKYDLPVDKK